MNRRHVRVSLLCLFLSVPISLSGQIPPAASSPPPPPATKLEAFKPAAGTVVTMGYDEIGKVRGISVDAREFRTAGGSSVRGLVVEVNESQYRTERSFVDADEVAELLRGIDALLEVKANPTSFENFEVRYTTKGELRLTAFNSPRNNNRISYSVEAGRVLKGQQFIDEAEMRKLREYFATAQEKLGTATAR